MKYVYMLQSESQSDRYYVGCTHDLKKRFDEYNAEGSLGHTAKYKQWKLHTYMAFSDKKPAHDFEAYLKIQAGQRFQKLRLQIKERS